MNNYHVKKEHNGFLTMSSIDSFLTICSTQHTVMSKNKTFWRFRRGRCCWSFGRQTCLGSSVEHINEAVIIHVDLKGTHQTENTGTQKCETKYHFSKHDWCWRNKCRFMGYDFARKWVGIWINGVDSWHRNVHVDFTISGGYSKVLKRCGCSKHTFCSLWPKHDHRYHPREGDSLKSRTR